MQTVILSRASLSEIIQRPSIDLYRRERARYPMEDLIQDMRSQDLHIEPVPALAEGKGHTSPAFRVSFEYPDRVKAQAVVRNLTTRFSELTTRTAGAVLIEVLTPASLPEKPIQPNRVAIMGIGLGVGLGLGILFAFLRRRPLKWTLRMAGCTVAGCALAAAVCYLMPDTFPDDRKSYQFAALGAFTGLALGAFLLRDRATGGNHYARLIAFSAACGAIAGGLVSFALPERYVSTAVLRIFRFPGGGAVAAQLEVEPAERVRQLTEDILSRGSLSALIQRPSLDLYRKERQRYPLEDIIDDMRRRDIRIAPAPLAGLTGLGPVTSFQISFEYADRYKAQAVVRELVAKFVEGNVTAERKLHRDKMPGSLAFEVAEPAALPTSPVSPSRSAAAAIGVLAGMLLGSLLALRRGLAARRQAAALEPRPPYGRYALTAAALGAIVAGLGSLVIPSRYASTAVLRLVRPKGQAAENAQAAGQRLREMFQQVLSRDTLAEIIVRPELQLYARAREHLSIEEVIEQMRESDLRVEPLPGSPLGGHTTAFRISFEYPEREKAQACVQALVSKFVESGVDAHRQRDAAHLFDNQLAEGALPLTQDAVPAPPAGPILPEQPTTNHFATTPAVGSGETQGQPARAYHPQRDAAHLFDNNLVESALELPQNTAPVPPVGPILPEQPTTNQLATNFAVGSDDTQGQPDSEYLEVLDAASVPEAPVGPNRVTISAAGCLAGLLLGIAIARARRQAPHPAPA
jgi:uncharacterized protein involved in exopolysaccharide biosynthesis